MLLDELNSVLASQGEVAKQLNQKLANFGKINEKLTSIIQENLQMAVKWYASGNYFSMESFRQSGYAGLK